MAVASRGRAELQIPKKWKEREISPERTPVWSEPKLKTTERKVPVVYYLSRNGQLEHPHFMEVPLSSTEGLYLKDVINRLNLLRGKGMASMYSWSSKRSYKNGFVWHDLGENDLIHPAQGKEYVLKGSELLLDGALIPQPHETESSTSKNLPEKHKSSEDSVFQVTRRRNQSWSSVDLHEYKVYKAESSSESSGHGAADASTQTDDKRRRRRRVIKEEETEEPHENQTTELSREEVSPPPSDSSPETLESLMKADGRLVLHSGCGNEDGLNRTVENNGIGKMKPPSVLKQLISCGSVSFKDCGASSMKDHRFSLLSHYKSRLPRGAGNQAGKEVDGLIENPIFSRLTLEDKEYFSGSLIETKKDLFPALKRSSSYNADRCSQLELAEKELEGVRAKCIPRRAKAVSTRNYGNNDASSSQHENKRLQVRDQVENVEK